MKDCGQDSVIRQPLVFGNKLTMHIPLCKEHSEVWERFVADLRKHRKQSAEDDKLLAWALDAALAYGTIPHK